MALFSAFHYLGQLMDKRYNILIVENDTHLFRIWEDIISEFRNNPDQSIDDTIDQVVDLLESGI